MDTNDLNRLVDGLEAHGLKVVVDEADHRLLVSNPLNGMLCEEITAVADRYITSFDYEIGERGQEAACAERIARILAAAASGQEAAT